VQKRTDALTDWLTDPCFSHCTGVLASYIAPRPMFQSLYLCASILHCSKTHVSVTVFVGKHTALLQDPCFSHCTRVQASYIAPRLMFQSLYWRASILHCFKTLVSVTVLVYKHTAMPQGPCFSHCTRVQASYIAPRLMFQSLYWCTSILHCSKTHVLVTVLVCKHTALLQDSCFSHCTRVEAFYIASRLMFQSLYSCASIPQRPRAHVVEWTSSSVSFVTQFASLLSVSNGKISFVLVNHSLSLFHHTRQKRAVPPFQKYSIHLLSPPPLPKKLHFSIESQF
jgi:hypothetical protein